MASVCLDLQNNEVLMFGGFDFQRNESPVMELDRL